MRNTLARLWGLTSRFHRAIWIVLALILVHNGVRLIEPFLYKELLDSIIGGRFSPQKIVLFLVLTFASQQLTLWVGQRMDARALRVIVDVEHSFYDQSYAKLLSLPLGYHEGSSSGQRIKRLYKGTDKIVELLAILFYEILPTVVQVGSTVIVLTWVGWPIAIAFLCGVPAFMVLTYRLNLSVDPWRVKQHDLSERESTIFHQAAMNVRTIQAYSQETRETESHRDVLNTVRDVSNGRHDAYLAWDLRRGTLQNAIRVVVLGLGILLFARGHITAGTVVMVLSLSERAFMGLYRLSRIFDKMKDAGEAVDRLITLLDTQSDIVDAPDAVCPTGFVGEVAFRDVSFSYPAAAHPALENVSFTISPGTQVAIVGPSGSGKSTIVKLLYRHADPQSGAVCIDGLDVRTLQQRGFRRLLGIVPQDLEMFDCTIRENIAYADPSAPLGRVMEVARMANIHEFIAGLPHGYDALVGERGVKLSGGQRQRIGIARALLADPRIIVFDEATSSLDPISEREIQKALETVRRDRTVIVIAHRLSTIRRSDSIIVLEGGRVVEQGDHTRLVLKNGLYSRLNSLQISGDVVIDVHDRTEADVAPVPALALH